MLGIRRLSDWVDILAICCSRAVARREREDRDMEDEERMQRTQTYHDVLTYLSTLAIAPSLAVTVMLHKGGHDPKVNLDGET